MCKFAIEHEHAHLKVVTGMTQSNNMCFLSRKVYDPERGCVTSGKEEKREKKNRAREKLDKFN